MDVAVPAINADLAAQMTAKPGNTVPQFVESEIYVGDVMNVKGPAICVCDAGEDDGWTGAGAGGLMGLDMATQIRIKTLYSADNAPEDYAKLFTITVDTLRDLFNQQAHSIIQPISPTSGNPLLPGGAAFKSCRMTGARPMNFPVNASAGADKVTYCRGWLVTHIAKIEYNASRPYALGQ